jgi:Na+-driven multidrug efflux pump
MAFGVGMAAVPRGGMAMGAGQVARARRVAWSGGAMAAALLGALGLVVMVWPQLWSGIFTSDPAVRAYADLYLRTVGPAFGLFGLGLVLYFASLGAGRVWAPVLAGTLRLLIVVGGGGWLMSSGLGSAQSLFVLVAVAMAAYGAGTAWAVWRARWG